jgi:hypothetical protein
MVYCALFFKFKSAAMVDTSEQRILENGHEFVTGKAVGFRSGSVLHDKHVCLNCGVVRRIDGKNRQCRGKVRVTMRGTTR